MRNASIVVLFALMGCAQAAYADRDFRQSVAADAKGTVTINNTAGSVRVMGWNRNEVLVEGKLEEDVERVDVESSGARTSIKVVLPRRSRNGGAELDIRVPRGSEVEITTVSADVNVQDVLGEQRLRSVSGDIVTQVAGADVDLKTVSGDVELRASGKPVEVRASTVSGDFTLRRGAGSLEITTVSGDVEAELDPARSVRVRTTSGDVHFKGRLARNASVNFESISGELEIDAPAEAGFSYDVKSFSGDIETCFGMNTGGSGNRGNVIVGKRGEGAAEIRARTMSGGIRLCDQ